MPREAFGGVVGLTATEVEVVRAAARGEEISDTARRLSCSRGLITDRRKMVLAKFQARTIAQAVAIAFARGILHADDVLARQ
jgi:DNA-binding CsgD family transcriptional regulator